MASSETPIATVYVNNLEERVRIEQLKDALAQIFSEYGTLVEIVAKSNLRAKGQAFIVFSEPDAAQAAISELQGFELFEKPMRLALAKSRSDATVRNICNADEFDQHKRKRAADKDKRRATEAADQQKKLKLAATLQDTTSRGVKAPRGAGLKANNPSTATLVPDEYLPPNKTLFAQNIPDDYDVDSLTSIFGRFNGFKEVRLVPGRKGIAFVEYDTEHGAISAKENTAGMAVGEAGQLLKVTYQRQ